MVQFENGVDPIKPCLFEFSCELPVKSKSMRAKDLSSPFGVPMLGTFVPIKGVFYRF